MYYPCSENKGADQLRILMQVVGFSTYATHACFVYQSGQLQAIDRWTFNEMLLWNFGFIAIENLCGGCGLWTRKCSKLDWLLLRICYGCHFSFYSIFMAILNSFKDILKSTNEPIAPPEVTPAP